MEGIYTDTRNMVKKYLKVSETISQTKSSMNEISLTAFPTLSLTDLKKNFTALLEDGTLTQNEYDAIFSKETVNELRPYKGELMNLNDTEMGIVSREYATSIISYIIGIELPGGSMLGAKVNAKKFVENKLHMFHPLFDIWEELPIDIFIANNYKKVIRSKIRLSDAYVPVMIDDIYNEGDRESHSLSLCMIEFPLDNGSVEDVLSKRDAIIQEYKKDFIDNDNRHINKKLLGLCYNIKDGLKDLLKNGYSLEEIDLSKTLSPQGRKYKLPVLERHFNLKEDPYYYDYLDQIFG